MDAGVEGLSLDSISHCKGELSLIALLVGDGVHCSYEARRGSHIRAISPMIFESQPY